MTVLPFNFYNRNSKNVSVFTCSIFMLSTNKSASESSQLLCNTGWPRKNATTLIVNFKNIINKIVLFLFFLFLFFVFVFLFFFFIMWEIHFPTKWHHDHQFWVMCLDPSAVSVRQCNFQNLILFRPHRTLEHNKIPTSRRLVRWQSPCFENEDNVNKRSYSLRNSWFSGTPWSEKFLLFQGSLGSKK